MQAEVDALYRSITVLVAGIIARALVSMIMGCSLRNTAYGGEMGFTCLEEAEESLVADWLI